MSLSVAWEGRGLWGCLELLLKGGGTVVWEEGTDGTGDPRGGSVFTWQCPKWGRVTQGGFQGELSHWSQLQQQMLLYDFVALFQAKNTPELVLGVGSACGGCEGTLCATGLAKGSCTIRPGWPCQHPPGCPSCSVGSQAHRAPLLSLQGTWHLSPGPCQLQLLIHQSPKYRVGTQHPR